MFQGGEAAGGVGNNMEPVSFPSDFYIVDVGMNDGADSLYYWKRGFRVLAIEANPKLVEKAEGEFRGLGADIDVICAAVSDRTGSQPFYVNKNNDVWSSLQPDTGARRGGSDVIEVETCDLSELLLPHCSKLFYVKIDIEGYDGVALSQVLRLPELPRYISVENGNKLMIEMLSEKGFSKFKFYNQRHVRDAKIPQNSQMGEIVGHTFPFGSSGLFGEDLPGRWLSADEALTINEGLVYGRNLAPENLWAEGIGWFDLHASRV